jgi:hypothetical protein
MLSTGSPGRAFVRVNVRSVIPKRRGMKRRSFLMKYALIVFPSFTSIFD